MSDEQKLLAACVDYRAKLDALEAENAALRADKARLDWLERRTVSRLQAVLDHVELHKLPIREAIDLAIEEIGQ
jgi:hypothetical protein